MTVSVKLPEDQIKYLQKMSHYFSIERDENLTLSDLIREALSAQYPMPVDTNGNEKNSTLSLQP